MFLIHCNTVAFILVINYNQVNGLIELPPVKDNDIMLTEAAIRNTINNLVSSLGVTRFRDNPKFNDYTLVHNYFMTLTLQDHKVLDEISKLTRVDKKNIANETENFINLINEILDGDDKSFNRLDTDVVKDNTVVTYVDNFLSRIKHFKQNIASDAKYKINDEILKYLSNTNSLLFNMTAEDNSTEYDTLSENEFWEPSGRRIYQGDRTKIKYFPFMASVQIFNKFHCGGSIVKSDLIITAASCLQLAWNNRFFRENPAFLSVRVGSNFYNGGGENIPILEIYFHPEYNPKNLRNNLSLLRLLRKLKFSKRDRRVKKIDIDRNPSSLSMTTDGITVVGWGAKSPSNIFYYTSPNQLAFSVLDIYPLQECQEIYSSEYVTRKNFCAGFFSKGGGACNRDVGGPGIVNGKLNGVISFGSPVCGTPNAPTVFTKLGHYVEWIEEIMELDVPYVEKGTTFKNEFKSYTLAPYGTQSPTTFKIEPIGGTKLKPIPINEVDSLRILNNEELFQEFLETMFSSKEIEEYGDLIKDTKVESRIPDHTVTNDGNIAREPVTESENAVFMTKIDNFEEDNSVTNLYKKYTKLDENLDPEMESNIERDIFKLIDDIDLKEIDSDESLEIIENKNKLDLNVPQVTKKENSRVNLKNIADSVLTLLYLSESEKDDKNVDFEDYEEQKEHRGLSIAADSFKDMTYRSNDRNSFINYLPKNEFNDYSKPLKQKINI